MDWGNVVTALITATATLTGVRLTQRHAAELRRQDRLEDRRVEQRTALAELLVTGREWTRSLDGLGLAAAKMEEVTESWGFERHLPLDVAHRRALTTARLVVRDNLMRAYVIRLSEMAAALPLEVGKVAKSRRETGRLATPEVLGKAVGEIAAYGRALDTLEEMTRVSVVDDPQDVRWRRRWHRFRRPVHLKHKASASR